MFGRDDRELYRIYAEDELHRDVLRAYELSDGELHHAEVGEGDHAEVGEGEHTELGEDDQIEAGGEEPNGLGRRVAGGGFTAHPGRAVSRTRRARVGAVAFVAMAVSALVAHGVRSVLQGAPGAGVSGPAAPAARAPATVPREAIAPATGRMRSSRPRWATGSGARGPSAVSAHSTNERPPAIPARLATPIQAVVTPDVPNLSAAATATAVIAAGEPAGAAEPAASEFGFER
jgi:hypothetical protein